jgi:hypothetical protein
VFPRAIPSKCGLRDVNNQEYDDSGRSSGLSFGLPRAESALILKQRSPRQPVFSYRRMGGMELQSLVARKGGTHHGRQRCH